MIYLESFRFPDASDELDYKLREKKLDMSCYDVNNAYPFGILTHKLCEAVEFEPITVFYGGNGSGKSTALNVIAERLGLVRRVSFNNTPFMRDYAALCSHKLSNPRSGLPSESAIITSDGVFDRLLGERDANTAVSIEREEIFSEYDRITADSRDNGWQMRSLSEYDELKKRCEIMRKSKSRYTSDHLKSKEQRLASNGESAYKYFTELIGDNALYLLDEPENSLSASLQAELAKFLLDQSRFYGCQFIISTHSPFLLSIRGARIYDLDSQPSEIKRWHELANVRVYYELFKTRAWEFEKD